MALVRLKAKKYLINDNGWTEDEWNRFTLWLSKHNEIPLKTEDDWTMAAMAWVNR